MAVAFRRLSSAVVCLAAPSILKPWLLRCLGHPISSGARIGVSLVLADRLAMAKGSSIGHLNLIVARRIAMREDAYIRSLNIIRRGMSLRFARMAAIGNRNNLVRGWTPQPVRPAILTLGELSKLTSEHYMNIISRCVKTSGSGISRLSPGFGRKSGRMGVFTTKLDRAGA